MTWTPHATVAVVVHRDDRFLMVEEVSDGLRVFNQPAGHVEAGESIVQAARREALEETGWQVEPASLLGLYTWQAPANGVTYYRFCFVADAVKHRTDQLDSDILAAHWLDLETLRSPEIRLRSPLVMRCIEDYLGGKRFPLSFISELY